MKTRLVIWAPLLTGALLWSVQVSKPAAAHDDDRRDDRDRRDDDDGDDDHDDRQPPAASLSACCPPGDKDFPKVGGNLGNQNYSALRQINQRNIGELGAVWRTRLQGGVVTNNDSQ